MDDEWVGVGIVDRLQHLLGRKFLALLLVLVMLGVFFRFVNLDHKVYWHDEVYTSLRINGYNGTQVVEAVFTGEVIGVEDLLKFQRPSAEKGLNDAIAALVEHPEHPPLYYIIAHFWTRVFGGSVAATRSLSAAISLLVFPGLYWLCWELFGNPVIGGYAIALMAVSPFHVLYAQEARQYSLWTLSTLLASAALLRARRRQQWRDWGLYSATLALNFYTFLLSSLVAIAHFLYLFLLEKFPWTRRMRSFFISGCLSLLLFAPWLGVLLNNYATFQDKTSWTKVKEPLTFLATLWGLHLSSTFVDLGFELYSIFNYIIILICLLVVGYALFLLIRQTSPQIWLFIVLLIAIPALGLILPDLIRGGRASSASRYFVPCYIGWQLGVAYLIYQLQLQHSKLFAIALALFLSVGAISCGISAQKYSWWNKALNYHNPEIAEIINNTSAPLVTSDDYNINVGNILSLSHNLAPKVKLLLVPQGEFLEIPRNFSDIFVFNPSPELVANLKQREDFQAELIYELSFQLWKLTPIQSLELKAN